jgi:hypothetical protein
MIKVRHFVHTADWAGGKSIDTQINEFLKQPNVEFVDVKHSSSFNPNGNDGGHYTAGTGVYSYSAILIYKEL